MTCLRKTLACSGAYLRSKRSTISAGYCSKRVNWTSAVGSPTAFDSFIQKYSLSTRLGQLGFSNLRISVEHNVPSPNPIWPSSFMNILSLSCTPATLRRGLSSHANNPISSFLASRSTNSSCSISLNFGSRASRKLSEPCPLALNEMAPARSLPIARTWE